MSVLLNNPVLLAFASLTIVNLVLLLILSRQFLGYRKRQQELLAGEEKEELSEIVLKHKKALASHKKNLVELGKILAELLEKNNKNIQKTGLVRFNPFADAGSNLSFTCALLDANNNGIVISSLHGREGTRIYAKPVENGHSSYPLTDEEKQAIKQAK
ncbi:MAG: DUF4446 family protein [Candidatus Doudnabacteria bacterium]|nr:DUF4446 family protein [Candidatus Doudnabacteria bacterium]